jgi:hypothetical protein
MVYWFHNERGVTYLFLMFAIVLIGISTTAAAKSNESHGPAGARSRSPIQRI